MCNLPIPDYLIFGLVNFLFLFSYRSSWKISQKYLQIIKPFIALTLIMFLISAVHFFQDGANFALFNGSMRMIFYCFNILILASFSFRYPHLLINILTGFLVGSLYTCLMLWVNWYEDPKYLFGFPILHNTSLETLQFSINRNYVGYYLGAGFSMGLGLLLFDNNLHHRKLTFVILSLIFGCILLTMSRSLILSTLLLMAICTILSINRINFFRKIFNVTIILAIATGILFFTGLFKKLLFWISLIRLGDRIQLLMDSFKVIMSHPLLGVGDGNYRMAVGEAGGHITKDPHNSITWIMAEYGILVGCIFLMLYLFALMHNLKQANKCLLPLAIYIGLRSFHTGLTISSGHFALWFALTFLLTNLTAKMEEGFEYCIIIK